MDTTPLYLASVPEIDLFNLVNEAFVGDDERKQLTRVVANELSVFADQYGRIRYSIQTEAQTYTTLPFIPEPTSNFLVQHTNEYSCALKRKLNFAS